MVQVACVWLQSEESPASGCAQAFTLSTSLPNPLVALASKPTTQSSSATIQATTHLHAGTPTTIALPAQYPKLGNQLHNCLHNAVQPAAPQTSPTCSGTALSEVQQANSMVPALPIHRFDRWIECSWQMDRVPNERA